MAAHMLAMCAIHLIVGQGGAPLLQLHDGAAIVKVKLVKRLVGAFNSMDELKKATEFQGAAREQHASSQKPKELKKTKAM